ncbi:MAG: hypothetical protein AB7T59_19045 [Hyphomonadaceae bacterium]
MGIDDWLKELAQQAPDRSLRGLETRVWAAIGDRQRAPSAMALWGWRSATAAMLLTIGLLTQGVSLAQAAPSEFDLFSPHAALAPSTLLGDGQ